MEQTRMYTLKEWEDLLAPLFEEVRLIGELPLGDGERVQLAHGIRTLIKVLGLTRATDHLVAQYPHVFVAYLALTAARNEERGFWDVVAQEVGVSGAGQLFHPRHHWGKHFISILENLGLETFPHVPTGTQYITRIRLHGGIPAYSLPDFFEHILLPAVDRPEYAGLTPKNLLNAVLQRSEVQYFVDRPVRLFLQEAGDVALGFFHCNLEMVRAWKSTGDIPPAEEVGLPTYVVETFHDFIEGQVEAKRSTRLRPPRLYLDPLAPDALYFLDLPSQPIAASQTGWRYTWHWEVTTQTGQIQRGETHVRVTRQGDKFWTHAVEMVPLDVPPGRLVVSFIGCPPKEKPCVIRRWRFPLVPNEHHPVLSFRAENGRFLSSRATIPTDEVWLLIPAGAQVQVIGQGRLVEEFPQMYGEWSAWRVEAWDLSEAQGIRLVDDQGRDMAPPIPTARTRVAPELIPNASVPWQEFDPKERPLFVSTVPKLVVPRITALPPREEMRHWRVEIYRQRPPVLSPCAPQRSLLDLKKHVEVQDRAFLLHLNHVVGDDIAGIYEVVVRGPSRTEKHLCFRAWPQVEVESLPPYILPSPKGHTTFAFRLHLPVGAVVRVQSGVDDVSVSPTDEPGTFLVQVGKERSIIPLILIRERDTGPTEQVPVHIGIPRLRWLLALEEEESLAQPQANVISLPTAALLQSHRAFLILDWNATISPDQFPPMRLVLVDPSEQVPRVLQEYDVDRPRPGQHRQVIPLGPFADTIRAHRDLPLLSFDLVVLDTSSQRLPLVHLTRAPDIDEVHIEWREDGRVYVHWHEPRPLRHRRLNLWFVSQPWRAPIQIRVPDVTPTSDMYPDEGWWKHDIGSQDEVPPGVYQLSFSTAHPWEPLRAPPQPLEEAILVACTDVEARLRALETVEAAADPFFVHFERAALYDYVEHWSRRNEAVRVLLDNLPAATPEQIVALVKWLEPRDPLAFKEAQVTMYRNHVLNAKKILSEEVQPSLRRAYMQWFTKTQLLQADTLEQVLESPGDVEWKIHALNVLLKRDIEKAVFYGLLLLDEGDFVLEDLISLFAAAADEVVRELRRHYPEQGNIIAALAPYLTDVIVFQEGALLETNVGVGIITGIQVNGHPVAWAFSDESNLLLKIHLIEEYRNVKDVEIDCTRKRIRFPGAKDLYQCSTCRQFVATSYSIVDEHHRQVHPGPGFGFLKEHGNEWPMKGHLRVLKFSSSDSRT